LLQPTDLKWDMGEVLAGLAGRAHAYHTVDAIVDALERELQSGDQVLIMSNGGFDGIHAKLLARLAARAARRA
jgi:UDP-N-acetylmuramate: L-alanyl-gamma-D-glutamyl-meso-diaminopimelate ligase